MGERVHKATSFSSPARCSHDGDDSDLVYDYRSVFHKDGVRKSWLGRKSYNPNAQFAEAILIRFVLRNCSGKIDRLSRVKSARSR